MSMSTIINALNVGESFHIRPLTKDILQGMVIPQNIRILMWKIWTRYFKNNTKTSGIPLVFLHLEIMEAEAIFSPDP